MKRLRRARRIYREELHFIRLEQQRPSRITALAATIVRLTTTPAMADGRARAEVDAHISSMEAARLARRGPVSGGAR
jgi:hypothetical protein